MLNRQVFLSAVQASTVKDSSSHSVRVTDVTAEEEFDENTRSSFFLSARSKVEKSDIAEVEMSFVDAGREGGDLRRGGDAMREVVEGPGDILWRTWDAPLRDTNQKLLFLWTLAELLVLSFVHCG